MASPTRWTWVWVNSGRWWWTGRPGMLWFMGLQRVGHDWATELNWTERLLCPWGFPGKSTGVVCHFLLQGIFLTQGSNPGFPHCRQMLYCLSHQGRSQLYLLVALKLSITDINGVSEQLSALFTTLTRDKSAHWRRDSLFMKEKKVSRCILG